jgi:Fe-S cluster assembly protein SufB
VPTQIKKQFKKLHIPNHEAKYLSGVHNQFDSGGIYSNLLNELQTKKVIFCSMEDAIIKYPKIVKKYLSKLVPISDNKYAALNTAVFSGGSFLYVPKNVIIDKPVQAYFRINSKSLGQFERTLIVCEEGAQVHYMEGCTAPTYDANNLHAAVVEVFVKKNAHCQYSTIQN